MSQQATKDMAKHFYRASAADFLKITGGPISYWLSDKVIELFDKLPALGGMAEPKVGLMTSDNDRFLRFHWEVANSALCLDATNSDEAAKSRLRWFSHNKGGSFKKWYGNQEHVVDWEDNGRRIKDCVIEKYPYLNGNPNFVVHDDGYYFRPMVSWSEITSGSLAFRYYQEGFTFNIKGMATFATENVSLSQIILLCNSKFALYITKALNPTLSFGVNNFRTIPAAVLPADEAANLADKLIEISKLDWDDSETSWNFKRSPMATSQISSKASLVYQNIRLDWARRTEAVKELEEEANQRLITLYGLEQELGPEVPVEEVTLSCNPRYRYGDNKTGEELEELLKSDTFCELVSYSIGCMMGRYSLDKPGLILASQGETLQDYLRQIPSPRFTPDDDAILPLTDQEWFADDATNRFREFVRVVWGDEHLQENLDFVAESLYLHAIKPKRGESALDTIRRYLSTQFYKDHLRTYKKRPIYWLFSSGKQKAFECLVYLHRYNEGTLARMRTEYVIPLSAKLNAYAEKLEQDKEASTSAAETKRLEKETATLYKQQAELAEFDEKLRHYADQRISLDLDDGVKVNYGKFGDLLAEVKSITGNVPGVSV